MASQKNLNSNNTTSDYRGFIFVVHDQHGLMLLHCTRKKKKGPHFQLPGGHINKEEFVAATKKYKDNWKKQLLEAGKIGAARELWEETSIDVRDQLERLEPAPLRTDDDCCGVDEDNGELACEVRKRLFFSLTVADDDFPTPNECSKTKSTNGRNKEKFMSPLGNAGTNLRIKYSAEYSGFTFQKDPKQSIKLLLKHSGGVPSIALSILVARDQRNKSLNDKAPVLLGTKPKQDIGILICRFPCFC